MNIFQAESYLQTQKCAETFDNLVSTPTTKLSTKFSKSNYLLIFNDCSFYYRLSCARTGDTELLCQSYIQQECFRTHEAPSQRKTTVLR